MPFGITVGVRAIAGGTQCSPLLPTRRRPLPMARSGMASHGRLSDACRGPATYIEAKRSREYKPSHWPHQACTCCRYCNSYGKRPLLQFIVNQGSRADVVGRSPQVDWHQCRLSRGN